MIKKKCFSLSYDAFGAIMMRLTEGSFIIFGTNLNGNGSVGTEHKLNE